MAKSKDPKPEYDQFLVRPKNPVKYAFTVNQTHYWQFESLDKLPILRKEAMDEVQDQLNNKIDNLYLDGFVAAMEESLNQGNLVQAANLLGYLKERRTYITSTEMLYKMAAVLYFDYDENPHVFDYDHADVKIAEWRKENVDDFFLKTHFYPTELLMNSTLMNFQTFTRMERKKVKKSLDFLLSVLPETEGNLLLRSSIQSLTETYKKLNTLEV